MQDFIVLGMVPGTNIQFNFQQWLVVCIILTALTLVYAARHLIWVKILSRYASWVIRHHDYSPLAFID